MASNSVLQWFFVAFFGGFGAYLLWRPDFMTRTSPKLLCVRDSEDEQRVKDVMARRYSIERISHLTGYAAGIGSLVIAGLTALNVASPALMYAVFCTFLSLTTASVYRQLRNSQERRVAVLQARSGLEIIPTWLVALVTASALSLLTYLDAPGMRAASIIVLISSLITIAAAWRLTSLPALLQGIDLNVELAIDKRVRFVRTAGVLMFAAVQPFMFASQRLNAPTTVQTAAYFLTLAAFLSVFVWVVLWIKRPLSIPA